MKKIVLLLAIFTLMLSILTSCEKEKEQKYLPQIVEYYKFSPWADTIGAIQEDSVVTVSDEGGKVYEVHYLQKGCRYVKMIAGFAPELLGEQFLNQKMLKYLYGHDKKVNSSTFILKSEWDNWFTRNQQEGFGYTVKKMGAFLLPSKTSKGIFIYEEEALIAWTGSNPVSYYSNNLYDGLPTEKIENVELWRYDIYCSIPIFNFEWYH